MAVEAVHGSRTLGVHGVVQVCRYVLDKEETQWVGETKLDDVVSFIDRLQRGVSAVASAPAEEQDVLVCIRGVSVLGGKWTVGGGVGVGLLHLGSRPRHLNLTHF